MRRCVALDRLTWRIQRFPPLLRLGSTTPVPNMPVMIQPFYSTPRALLRLVFCGAVLSTSTALRAQDAAPSAQNLSTRLSDAVLDNSSTVRLKIESRATAGGAKSVIQVQVKARRTKAATELVYQILWPKERKGEAFLLRKPAGRPAIWTTRASSE